MSLEKDNINTILLENINILKRQKIYSTISRRSLYELLYKRNINVYLFTKSQETIKEKWKFISNLDLQGILKINEKFYFFKINPHGKTLFFSLAILLNHIYFVQN